MKLGLGVITLTGTRVDVELKWLNYHNHAWRRKWDRNKDWREEKRKSGLTRGVS